MVYDAQIVEVKEYTSDVAESAVLKMTPKQIRAKALEGYFVRDAERNLVYCSWSVIERLTSETPKQNTHVEAINIQIELSDTLNEKIFDSLKSIQKNLQEMKSDSVIVIVDKVHK